MRRPIYDERLLAQGGEVVGAYEVVPLGDATSPLDGSPTKRWRLRNRESRREHVTYGSDAEVREQAQRMSESHWRSIGARWYGRGKGAPRD